MRVRLVLAVLTASVCSLAQQTLTLDQLLSFIRSAIQLKQPDKQVASYVSKLKLSERLDDRIVEQLQGEGAGPKTVAALTDLATQSASLPKPEAKVPEPPPPPIPPPSSEEQQAVISEIREYAAAYSSKLPDFICMEVTRRYWDPTGQEFWRSADTLTTRLSYFEQKENYKLMMVNNRYVETPYESVGGATSVGDFGSMLRVTLARKADAMIDFDRWATLRGRRTYVFAYSISSGNSDYSIRWERDMRIVVAYRGLLYVDKETHQVLRITLEATDIPPTFPVQEAREVLDYGYQTIGDHPYLLPLKAEVRMRHDKELTKTAKEFRLYQKFSAEAEIKFDNTPAPLPEDQTKEQPPK